MAVLGIITCETLEQELACLLANDHEIEGVTVLQNSVSKRLIQMLELRVETYQGTMEILNRTWQAAKASLSSLKDGYRREV